MGLKAHHAEKELVMKWTEEAEKAISKVPFFVRKRVRKRVEQEARNSGDRKVRIEHVRTCRNRLLTRMEDEVKGYQVENCFGAGGCPNRVSEYEGFAEELEKRLSERDLKTWLKGKVGTSLKFHHEFRVSVSDCPNACSRPQIVDVGFIGAAIPSIAGKECRLCSACVEACREGAVSLQESGPVIDYPKCLFCSACAEACETGKIEKVSAGYRIMLGGKLGRHPRLARELKGIYSPAEALEILDRVLDHYQDHCAGGERLGETLERTGTKEFEKKASA
jgi:dissimilatory sulfite reductase (desulfoviridin) alpha/beta subunit